MQYNFLDYNTPDRLRLLQQNADPEYIYLLIQRHMGIPMEEVKAKYEVTLHKVRQRIFIKGNYVDIFNLFQALESTGLKYESVTSDLLRIDFNHFIHFVR